MPNDLQVEVRGELIFISQLGTCHLHKARRSARARSDKFQSQDHELRAQLWEAANDKARELGWIK